MALSKAAKNFFLKGAAKDNFFYYKGICNKRKVKVLQKPLRSILMKIKKVVKFGTNVLVAWPCSLHLFDKPKVPLS